MSFICASRNKFIQHIPMLHPYRGLREKLFQKVFSAPTGGV